MRGMILAAGRGERMGELTLHTPKPLLRVGNHYLIEYAILQFVKANILDIVINVSYCAQQIQQTIGNGARYHANILYSYEEERLETGGGIVKALPLLGDEPFIVMSCDIVTDLALETLPKQFDHLAHLVMVSNPNYHVHGDFGLENNLLTLNVSDRLTFANIGVYHPKLFKDLTPNHFRLTKVLIPAIENKLVTGEHFKGRWFNVGTPEDLQIVQKDFALTE